MNRELDRAAAVFAGKVTDKREFPSLATRKRYAVNFAVEKNWKGANGKEFVVHTPAGPTDCDNIDFTQGRTYIVFAQQRDVWKDSSITLGDGQLLWHDPWNDVLPVGSKIFVVRMCTNTRERGDPGFDEIIAQLGWPKATLNPRGQSVGRFAFSFPSRNRSNQ